MEKSPGITSPRYKEHVLTILAYSDVLCDLLDSRVEKNGPSVTEGPR